MLALLLCIMMIVTTIPVSTLAAGGAANISATVSATEVNVGDTFTVLVSYEAMTVASFACQLKYDGELVEFVSAAPCDPEYPDEFGLCTKRGFVAGTISTPEEAKAVNQVGFVVPATEEAAYQACDIYTATFTAKAAGTVTFTLVEDSDGTDGFIGTVETKTVTIVDPNAPVVPTSGTAGFVSSELGYENGIAVEDITGEIVSFDFEAGGNSNVPKYYSTGSAVRFYSKNSLAISVVNGYKIKSITVAHATGENAMTASNTTLTNASASYGSNETVLTPADGTQSVVMTYALSSKHWRVTGITVEYEKVDPDAVVCTHEDTKAVSNGDGKTHKIVCMNEACGATVTASEACAGGTATCEEKAVCTLCLATYGELANHNYVNGTCTACGDKETNFAGRYYIATIRSSGNYWYMTNSLGTASTKRYQAVDSGLTELPEAITAPAADKIFVLEKNEDGTYSIYAEGIEGDDKYLGWTSENSGTLVAKDAALKLTVDLVDGLYNIHFTASDGERYLALNGTTGNNYFAWYKSEQKQDLALIPVTGEVNTCEHENTKLVPNNNGTHNIVCADETCGAVVKENVTCSGTDDNDCTTAVTCECGYVVTAATSHTPGADDGDCTTAVKCANCEKNAVEAKTHVAGADDGDCTTAVKCVNCEKNAVEAKEAHVAGEDDGDCTTAVKCINCEKNAIDAKEEHGSASGFRVVSDGAGTGTHTKYCNDCNAAIEGEKNVACSDVTTKDHNCDACGYVMSTCSDKDGDKNHACDICGKPDVTDHEYGEADCEAPATCSECGATTGTALGHIDENTDHVCDRNCGKTDMNMDKHVDSATDKDHVCDYGCKAVLEDCSGGTATCTEKAKCSVCNTAYGALNAANHTGEIAYTDNGNTHSSAYNCCNAPVVTNEEHTYDESSNECICGAKKPETHVCAHYEYKDITETTHQSYCSCGEKIGTAEVHTFNLEGNNKCICGRGRDYATGLQRLPYFGEYKANAEDLAYWEANKKTSEYTDAETAMFYFDENGKLKADYTGIVNDNGTLRYAVKGMIGWHVGFVKDGDNYYYFKGDVNGGGNIATTGKVYATRNFSADKPVGGKCIYFFDNSGKLVKNEGIVEIEEVLYYFDSNNMLALGQGLVKLEDGYIYVRSSGKLAVGDYYIPANELGVVSALYTFDENGYMVMPKYTNVNGIVDGFYYKDGKVQYGAGLVEWEGDVYYVRSNGQVATDWYYVTNTNGMEGFDKGIKLFFGEDGKLQPVKNGIVEENGALYYYENNHMMCGAGLLKLEDENGVYYIYVRSSGKVQTGYFYITNTNGLEGFEKGDHCKFGEDGKLMYNFG